MEQLESCIQYCLDEEFMSDNDKEKIAQRIKEICKQLDGLSESEMELVKNVIEKLKPGYCCFKISD